jgi:sulfonate transport system substrate-binding protein
MKMFLRRTLVLAATAAFAGALVAAETGLAADTVTMGSRNTNLDVIMIEGGFAKKYDLELQVVRVKTGIEMAEALIGGGIDIGIVGGAPLVSALRRTKKMVVLGSAWTSDGGYAKVLVRPNSPFKTINDLKGKKIANKIGSGSYRALGDWCAKNDCKVSDFQILNTSPAAIIAALESGSVDAGIWFAPTTSIAVHRGIARILTDFKGANLGAATWTARKDFATKNKDILVRFMAATIDAQELIKKDPKKAATLLASGLKKAGRDLPVPVLEMGMNDFDYVHGMLDGKLVKVYSDIFDAFKKRGKYKGSKPDFTTFLDASIYQAALKKRN